MSVTPLYLSNKIPNYTDYAGLPTRLCPLLPFNLLNYALGITQVSLKDYVLGSFGMIPTTMLYVYFGSLVGDIAAICTVNQPVHPPAEPAK